MPKPERQSSNQNSNSNGDPENKSEEKANSRVAVDPKFPIENYISFLTTVNSEEGNRVWHDVLSKYFNVQKNTEAFDLCKNALRELINDTRMQIAKIDNLPEQRQALLTSYLDEQLTLYHDPIINSGTNQLNPKIGEQAIANLNVVADALHMTREQYGFLRTDNGLASEFESLKKKLEKISEFVHNSSLPEHIKIVVKRAINALIITINNHAIFGAERLIETHYNLLGQIGHAIRENPETNDDLRKKFKLFENEFFTTVVKWIDRARRVEYLADKVDTIGKLLENAGGTPPGS